MSLSLQTTTAVIDGNGELSGLERFESLRDRVVQIVVVTQSEDEYDDSDLTPEQWNHGVSKLMAPHFAEDPEEDIYTWEDGKPYDASQDQKVNRFGAISV